MKQTRILMTGLFLGLLIGMTWMYAQESSDTLTAQDYAEIGQLYSTINHGGDFRDADLWLSAFSDDAVFTIAIGPGQEIVGKEALTEWRHQSFRGQVGLSTARHWAGPPRISSTGKGMATGLSYFIVYDVSGKTPTFSSSGYHDDVFVKTTDGWRVKHRKAIFDAPPA